MGDFDSLTLVSKRWRKATRPSDQVEHVQCIDGSGREVADIYRAGWGDASVYVADPSDCTEGATMPADDLRDLAAQLCAVADFLGGKPRHVFYQHRATDPVTKHTWIDRPEWLRGIGDGTVLTRETWALVAVEPVKL